MNATFVVFVLFCTLLAPLSGRATPSYDLSAELEIGGDWLAHPVAVGVLPSSNLAILDRARARVVVVTATGAPLWDFGNEGSGPDAFARPADLVVDPAGEILVSDPENARVLAFSEFGDLLRVIPTAGEVDRLLSTAAGALLLASSYVPSPWLYEAVGPGVGARDGRGIRLRPEEFGLGPDLPWLEVSLNDFVWGRPSSHGVIPLYFRTLALVHLLAPDGTLLQTFSFEASTVDRAHAVWHEARAEQFHAGGRPETCARSTPMNLAADLAALSHDSLPHFLSTANGIGFWRDDLLVLSDGVLHRLDTRGQPKARYTLLTPSGGTAYAHALRVAPPGDAAVYTIDSAHTMTVRRHRLPDAIESVPSSGSPPDDRLHRGR